MRDTVIDVIDILYEIPFLPEMLGLLVLVFILTWIGGSSEEAE